MNTLSVDEQKQSLLTDAQSTLDYVYIHFPWLVYDMTGSFYSRLGKENTLVQAVLKNISSAEFDKQFEAYDPECAEAEEQFHASVDIFGKFPADLVKKTLMQDPFTLTPEVQEECLPWDDALKNMPISLGLGAMPRKREEKLMVIQRVKSDIIGLRVKLDNMRKTEDGARIFHDEITLLNVILEVLDINEN